MQLQGRFRGPAVSEHAIYLGRDAAIWTLPKRAVSELTHFAAASAAVTKLAVLGDTIFWLTAGGAALSMASEDLGRARTLSSTDGTEATPLGDSGVALVASPSFLVAAFAREAGSFRVVRVARGGDIVVPYVDIHAEGSLALVADDDRVYARVKGAIGVWNEAGLLDEAPSRAVELAADADFLYWRGDADVGPPRFMRAPKHTLVPAVLADAPDDDLVLATDDTSYHLYWADSSGSLYSVSKAGGTPELRARTGPFDDDDYEPLLALDDTSVYWLGGRAGSYMHDGDPVWLYRICK